MLKSILVAIVLVAGVVTVSAKNVPTVAEKLPSELKEVITDALDYPKHAQSSFTEGDVWLKICVSDDATLRVVDMSATNPELGEYVKTKLSTLSLPNTPCKKGKEYFLKVSFDLIKK